MTTIAGDNTLTQVVEFETAPERQEALIAAIIAKVERWVRHRPGFVSPTFHASHDGNRVIDYAQLRRAADFEGYLQDEEGARLQAAVKNARPEAGPRATPCRVVRAIERASEQS